MRLQPPLCLSLPAAALLAAAVALPLPATGTLSLAGSPPPSKEAGAAPWLPAADRLDGPLGRAFRQAAAATGVPAELLAAIGYAATRLNGHGGQPSVDGGYGVMLLYARPDRPMLEEAAALLGATPDRVRTDDALNIRAAAALLARDAAILGVRWGDLQSWYPAVARYLRASPEAGRLFANEVYRILQEGFRHVTASGEVVAIAPRTTGPGAPVVRRPEPPVALPDPAFPAGQGGTTAGGPAGSAGAPEGTPNLPGPAAPGFTPAAAAPDYLLARWVPAHPNNYDSQRQRPSDSPIRYVVIHVTQGSYAGTIAWFQNPAAGVSAHYIIRSRDGDITQMVPEAHVAWHAGNSQYNLESIGIEHEGWVEDCTWFSDVMYRTSANLVRHITAKYGIPRDRQHIIGHSEVPGATHTDPGACWDWDFYMSLVTRGWSMTVDNATAGRFYASENWGISRWNSQRYGPDYRFATPVYAQDSAYYKLRVPASGYYDVFVWYPSHWLYNGRVRVSIWQATGPESEAPAPLYVDQRTGGGRWVHLGTFPLLRQDDWLLSISRWSDLPGYIIADAVRIDVQ